MNKPSIKAARLRACFVLLVALLQFHSFSATALEESIPLQSYSFAIMTNTTPFANTITIDFWGPASVLAPRKMHVPVCSRTKTLAPGSTWILSSTARLSPPEINSGKSFEGKACISTEPGDPFSYGLPQPNPVSGATGYSLSISGFPVEPASAPSCANCGVSIVFLGVDKNNDRSPYSGHVNNIMDHASWEKESFKASMVNADHKVADAVVYKLNRRHVAPKDVVRVAVSVLESDSRIGRFIQKRANLHRTLVGQHSLEAIRINAAGHVTQKATNMTTGDKYWLAHDKGGEKYNGNHICKPCLHTLAEIRRTTADLKGASRVESDAQKSIAKLKAENSHGYTLQQKYRLKRQIKDIEQSLRQAKSRSGKLKRTLKKAKIKLSNCKRNHC